MRMAWIYRRRERLFLRPWSKTDEGMWREDGPCSVLPASASAEEVGATVESVLALSRQGVSHPSRSGWSEVTRPLLEAAGVKSWRAFAKLANSVGIERDESGLRLLPMGRDPDDGSNFPVKERERQVPASASIPEIGRSVLEALDAAD